MAAGSEAGPWNRDTVFAWLNANGGTWVRIADRRGTLKVEGRCRGVDELDACSADLLESHLEPELPGMEVALVLHEHVLGVQLLAYAGAAASPRCAVPAGIPYAELRLFVAGEHGVTDPAAAHSGDRTDDDEYSPYELLFRDGR